MKRVEEKEVVAWLFEKAITAKHYHFNSFSSHRTNTQNMKHLNAFKTRPPEQNL